MVEQQKRQIRRNGGRFHGFRVNCEQAPMLPAFVVRLEAVPAQIHYLAVRGERGRRILDAGLHHLVESLTRAGVPEIVRGLIPIS